LLDVGELEVQPMIHPRRPPLVAIALVVLLHVSPGGAAPPGDGGARPASQRLPRFEAGLDVVNVSVSVSSPRGHVITGLRPEDFRVVEDGVPQDVVLFSGQSVPLSLALLVDGSGSMTHALPAVKAAATRLARTLGPHDEAALVVFSDRSEMVQDFTTDKSLVDAAIQGIAPAGPTALHAALYVMLKDPSLRPRPDEVRRRALVVLTDGEDTSSLVTDDQVLDLARQRDATVYTISLRGTRMADAERAPFADRAAYFLTALARETGGRSYFPRELRDLEGVYDRIAGELRAQYVIGYVPSRPAARGTWRRIAVESLRDDVVLHHRTGYYSGAPARSLERSSAAAQQ
jgi:Ca-activated chloride channel family protein